MKNLLKKSRDPYLALLAYRSTPLEVGFSPAELLMSRRLRTTVPDIQKQRQPSIPTPVLWWLEMIEQRKDRKIILMLTEELETCWY